MKGYLYLSAYADIVRTVQMDAAPGYRQSGDMTDCGYSLAKASREARADMEEFLISTRQFLATVGDKNCRVESLDSSYREWTPGFKARRKGEHLYVTEASEETEVRPGDEIYAIGGQRVSELRRQYRQNIFGEWEDEREDWDLFLRMFETIEVFRGDGTVRRVKIRRYPLERKPARLSCERWDDGLCYMKIESFAEAEAVARLVEEHEEELAGSRALILDLRVCEAEGEAESFLPLLPYLCSRSGKAGEIIKARELYTTYTKNNGRRMLAKLQAYRNSLSPEEEKAEGASLDEWEADIREKCTRVHESRAQENKIHERKKYSEIPETEETGVEEVPVEAADGPGRVVILTDVTCEYAGEWLVSCVKGFEKVKVIGRPTAGMLDYTRKISVDYEDIKVRFTYPMSRTREAKEGKGVAFRGVEPDIYVPFCREECTEDRILARAREEIE
ncbi:MAG: hypothetical protein HFI93_03930 [Lachnospiraceae bacterium]|nr:hypothetical protein [Lachnospiraceae bacterium]